MGFRGQFAQQQSGATHVRFGSKTDISECPTDIYFTSESGLRRNQIRELIVQPVGKMAADPNGSYSIVVTRRGGPCIDHSYDIDTELAFHVEPLLRFIGARS
jgi:hypothetical protein